MSGDRPSYSSYVRLEDVLTAQAPLTPRHEKHLWAAERFFIICHQTSELWISQILLDIDLAAAAAETSRWQDAKTALTRAASVSVLLSANLRQLMYLPREHFLRLRVNLEGTSAAESEQFRELLLGLRHEALQRVQASLARSALARPHTNCDQPCAHSTCGVARALDALARAISDWRRLHADVARYFIGDRPGTGGTSGVEYLRQRIEAECEEAEPPGFGRGSI